MTEKIFNDAHRQIKLNELKLFKKKIENGEIQCIPEIYEWCENGIKQLEDLKF